MCTYFSCHHDTVVFQGVVHYTVVKISRKISERHKIIKQPHRTPYMQCAVMSLTSHNVLKTIRIP